MTTLRVAEKFEKAHLPSPQVAPLVEAARVFYVEGYFLTHGTDSALELAKKASEASKVLPTRTHRHAARSHAPRLRSSR